MPHSHIDIENRYICVMKRIIYPIIIFWLIEEPLDTAVILVLFIKIKI